MSFLDKAKQKAQQYDLQTKAKHLADAAEKAARQTVHKAGDLAHDKRDTVISGLDSVAAKVDAKTDGKYADKVAKAKQQLAKGVDKLAEQGSAGTAADEAPPAQGAPTTPPAPATAQAPADPTVSEPPSR
jgi:methionine synthase I (cobalamin-dependent)